MTSRHERNVRRQIVLPLAQPPVIQPSAGGVLKSGSSTLADSSGLVSGQVSSILVNGGIQVSGPIGGSAGPPQGIGISGGEVVLCGGSFTLARAATVRIEAICSNFVLTTSGSFTLAHPIYLQIDGVSDTQAYGFAPVWANPGNGETRSMTTTLLKIVTLAAGPHVVAVIWNSEEGTTDTIHNGNNPIFVSLIGS